MAHCQKRAPAERATACRAHRRRDWQATRIGPTFTEHEIVLAQHVTFEVLSVCGVPPILSDSKASAGGQREGYRQLLLNTLRPIASLIAEETSRVVEQPVYDGVP